MHLWINDIEARSSGDKLRPAAEGLIGLGIEQTRERVGGTVESKEQLQIRIRYSLHRKSFRREEAT